MLSADGCNCTTTSCAETLKSNIFALLQAHIKRGNIVLAHLPRQPCATYCTSRLALWLMLVPVSYHEPFASSKHGLHTDPTTCIFGLLRAHIKRGKIVLAHLPRQPCATYCKSRLALWLMLVPVSYHEPFASSKHGLHTDPTTCIFGLLRAHIKRGKIVLAHLPRQPCATYCKSRLALWLMLVPVSYHEPFASSKHGLHTDPTTCIFGLLRAHIKRGKIVLAHLPRQPCATYCKSRLALWLMLVPVSYHEPFASSKHGLHTDPTTCIFGLLRAHISEAILSWRICHANPVPHTAKADLLCGWCLSLSATMSRLQAASTGCTQTPRLVFLDCAGTYKARQDCPGAFATPTLWHVLHKQTCFVADACPCQLPWAVCKQQARVAHRPHDLYFWIVAGTYKARQDCPGAFATPTLCHILQKQTCFVADACPCQLPWAVCKQQGTAGVSYTGHLAVGGPYSVDWIPRSRQYFWYQPSGINALYICLCQ